MWVNIQSVCSSSSNLRKVSELMMVVRATWTQIAERSLFIVLVRNSYALLRKYNCVLRRLDTPDNS